MEAIEPAKAAIISAMELMTTPRLRRTIITSETVSFAPEEIPSTKGPAMGLEKNVWSRKPDTLNAPPRMAAASTRGSRMPQIMPDSGPLSRVPTTSPGANSTLPACMFHTSSTSSRISSREKQRTYRNA